MVCLFAGPCCFGIFFFSVYQLGQRTVGKLPWIRECMSVCGGKGGAGVSASGRKGLANEKSEINSKKKIPTK